MLTLTHDWYHVGDEESEANFLTSISKGKNFHRKTNLAFIKDTRLPHRERGSDIPMANKLITL